jgi:hypothetical protein
MLFDRKEAIKEIKEAIALCYTVTPLPLYAIDRLKDFLILLEMPPGYSLYIPEEPTPGVKM